MNNWILFENHGLLDFIDNKGKEVVEPKYDKFEFVDNLKCYKDGKEEKIRL